MSESKFASLYSRALTGSILLLAIITAWYVGSYAFLLLICLASFIGQLEFGKLFLPEWKKREKFIAPAFGVFYLLCTFYYSSNISHALILMAILLFSTISLINFCNETGLKNMKSAAIMLFSFLYLPYILGFSLEMTKAQQVLVFSIPIVSDTVAYFAGISFGKRKIWASVSPKKSVEGSAAGLLATVLLIIFFGLNFNVFNTNSIQTFILIGIFISVFTQMGDFFESGIKRCVNVKDSGKILPGHGGVLDRIDSLIFTIAGFEICTTFLNL